MTHVVSSKTSMPVQRLMRIENSSDEIKVMVRWRGFPESEVSWEPLQEIYEDLPDLRMKLLMHKNASQQVASKA